MIKHNLINKFLVIAILITGSELFNPFPAPYTIRAQAETKDASVLAGVEDTSMQSDPEDVPEQAVGINIAYHTEAEIRAYLKSSGAVADTPGIVKIGQSSEFSIDVGSISVDTSDSDIDTSDGMNAPVTYKEKPSTKAPYKAGSLSDETLNSALNTLNQIRYIAGLSYNVTLNDIYTAKAQAASLVDSVNGVLTHYPEKPIDMEQDLYQLGADGACSSNLSSGFGSISESLVYGYMEDGDSSNIDRVGHRRWILDPEMSATGFGYCNGYSAMYAFGSNNVSAAEYGVTWPAQTMPTDYFGTYYPWSISMGYYINPEAVKVTLVRLRDSKTWSFGSSAKDGYFNVNNDGYGQTGCIIFRPEDIDTYRDGDRFQVTISGLETPISYQVSFFDLIPVTSIRIKENDTKLVTGESNYPEAEISPANASNQQISWSSSDDTIAAVSEYGTVEGKNYGTATITATNLSSKILASYEVTVIPESVYIKSITSTKKGQLTVAYESDKTVSGYEIVYAANYKFTGKKTMQIKKAAVSKATISGLRGGKTYYVKIRAYAVKDGKKIYGEYGWYDYTWVNK